MEIHKRQDKRWVIYKLSEPYAVHQIQQRILNQIYDILAELQPQGKKIILCQIPRYIGNEEPNKEAKTSNRYARNDYDKIPLYRPLLKHQEG